MRRREFIAGLGGAAVWPVPVPAQQPAPIRRVGVLMGGAVTEAYVQSYLAAFVQGLRQLGWTEGQNLRMDIRWNAADAGLTRVLMSGEENDPLWKTLLSTFIQALAGLGWTDGRNLRLHANEG